jgi:hypothetical protein
VHIVACVVSRVRSVDAYHFEQLYAALVLDASTRGAAAARSGLIDVHFAFVVDHAQMGRTSTRAHVRCSCKEADLAALVLDASTRVDASARSGLIDVHFAFVVDHEDGSHINVLMFGVLQGS